MGAVFSSAVIELSPDELASDVELVAGRLPVPREPRSVVRQPPLDLRCGGGLPLDVETDASPQQLLRQEGVLDQDVETAP